MGKVVRKTNSSTGGPVFVYVKDGKIIRMTPMDFDESDGPSWEISQRSYWATAKTVAPYTQGLKSMIYSDKSSCIRCSALTLIPTEKETFKIVVYRI